MDPRHVIERLAKMYIAERGGTVTISMSAFKNDKEIVVSQLYVNNLNIVTVSLK